MQSKRVTQATATSPATIELDVMTYYVDAYTDVSDSPTDSYVTVPNTDLPLTGFAPVESPAWTLQATPQAVLNGSTLTITIPDLVMQIGGIAGTTAYPNFSVAGIVPGIEFTATFVEATNEIAVSSATGLVVNQVLTGPGLPAGTMITEISGTTVSISTETTAAGSGVTIGANTPGNDYTFFVFDISGIGSGDVAYVATPGIVEYFGVGFYAVLSGNFTMSGSTLTFNPA